MTRSRDEGLDVLIATGWSRLEVLARSEWETHLQLVVGLGANSGFLPGPPVQLTGYGCLLTVGQMTDGAWAEMVRVARGAARECHERQMAFADLTEYLKGRRTETGTRPPLPGSDGASCVRVDVTGETLLTGASRPK